MTLGPRGELFLVVTNERLVVEAVDLNRDPGEVWSKSEKPGKSHRVQVTQSGEESRGLRLFDR
jgi:hypothetical protein